MFTIRVLSFFAGGEAFAADVALVQKIARKMKITPVPAAPREVAGIANLKGKVVSILNTAALLNRKQYDGTNRGPRTVNAVIFKPQAGGDQMGLVMDRAGDLDEIDENKIAPPPLAQEADEPGKNLHISGVFERGGIFYRIVDADSITGRFRDGGDAVSDRRGGTFNEENV